MNNPKLTFLSDAFLVNTDRHSKSSIDEEKKNLLRISTSRKEKLKFV